jgi:hypothetical protein
MVSGPNWARRYGVEHRRLCARRGCDAPAVATLRFQPTQRSAWLVDVDATASHSERDLCTRHATALILPTGWQLFDRRRASAPAGEEAPEPEPEQPQVAGEPLIDVLDARTPLLQRAFRNVWPGADSSPDSIDRCAPRPGESADVSRSERDEERDRGEDE